jgi:methionine synthase I (cobalamin-dependent)
MTRSPRTLRQRLSEGVVIGAEGYVFELERRGYIKAGPYVPEVVLDAPEAVLGLHREFLRAGAEVMVALTYYANREKLRVVGRDGDLEAMNRAAVRMAGEVAAEGDALVAANICNTWSYDPRDPARTGAIVRAQYEEQLGWAAEEGVDFVIHETNDYLAEALIGLEVCHELGLPAMVTFASVHPELTYDGVGYVEACRRVADAGATIVGLNCSRGPATIVRSPPSRCPSTPVLRPPRLSRSRLGTALARFPSRWSRSPARGLRWPTSPAGRKRRASGTSGSAAAGDRTTSVPWPRRLAARPRPAATRPSSSCTRSWGPVRRPSTPRWATGVPSES